VKQVSLLSKEIKDLIYAIPVLVIHIV